MKGQERKVRMRRIFCLFFAGIQQIKTLEKKQENRVTIFFIATVFKALRIYTADLISTLPAVYRRKQVLPNLQRLMKLRHRLLRQQIPRRKGKDSKRSEQGLCNSCFYTPEFIRTSQPTLTSILALPSSFLLSVRNQRKGPTRSESNPPLNHLLSLSFTF